MVERGSSRRRDKRPWVEEGSRPSLQHVGSAPRSSSARDLQYQSYLGCNPALLKRLVYFLEFSLVLTPLRVANSFLFRLLASGLKRPPTVINFITSQRDLAPSELPDYVCLMMAKTPSAWTIGMDAEFGWNLESSFLLAQVLGFQSSIMLERYMAGRDREVERHREIHHERDQARATVEEAKTEVEKARAASKE